MIWLNSRSYVDFWLVLLYAFCLSVYNSCRCPDWLSHSVNRIIIHYAESSHSHVPRERFLITWFVFVFSWKANSKTLSKFPKQNTNVWYPLKADQRFCTSPMRLPRWLDLNLYVLWFHNHLLTRSKRRLPGSWALCGQVSRNSSAPCARLSFQYWNLEMVQSLLLSIPWPKIMSYFVYPVPQDILDTRCSVNVGIWEYFFKYVFNFRQIWLM